MNTIHRGDCLDVLRSLDGNSIDMVYIDPPFQTGRVQYSARSGMSFDDNRSDYIPWVKSWMVEAHNVLKKTGTMYVHLDDRQAYRVRSVMDDVFGEDNYLSTVIWAYDYGGRGKNKWPAKHDVILVYTKKFGEHVFNWDEIDKIPYMAPGLQKDPARAAAGKVPTDVWWMSIVGTQSKERTGYPTQKPVKLIERAIKASCPPGGVVLDFFAGSGTTGEAAANCGRQFILCDVSESAREVMKKRFSHIEKKIEFV